MKKVRGLMASIFSLAMVFSTAVAHPVFAEGEEEPAADPAAAETETPVEKTEEETPVADAAYEVKFQGKVTDAGQTVSGMKINYGEEYTEIEGLDNDTFTVEFEDIVDYGKAKGEPYAYADKEGKCKIVKTSFEKGVVTVEFDNSHLSTLTWLAEGRNYPAKLSLEVIQKKDLTLKKVEETPDKRTLETKLTVSTDTKYTNNVTSYRELEDPEVAKFTSVKADIDYQYHEGTNDALIVWFHGNGEGNFGKTEDLEGANAAQMLANRGTVAWVTDKAQEVFGDATVMAFQAPSMWYFATRDNYLSKVKAEIDAVVAAKGISADKMYVSGCSAGGYMTTRMIITYPDLFKAAMINCPALDIASLRNVRESGNAEEADKAKIAEVVGATPTDAELEGLKNSRTAIWLVQGETDSSVDTENTSKRMWNALTKGENIVTSTHDNEVSSDFTTYETRDNKYKLSLYETVDVADAVGTMTYGETRPMGKIVVGEDYNLDGVDEAVKYNDHWSWIYTLRNNPKSADNTQIWQWAASYNGPRASVGAKQVLVINGEDWGPAVAKTVLTLDQEVTADSLKDFVVTETKESTNWADLSVYNASAARTVEKVYLSDAEGNATGAKSGKVVTVEMYVSPNDGAPFRYDVPTGSNKWCEPYQLVVDGSAADVNGAALRIHSDVSFNLKEAGSYISKEAQKFDVTKSFTGSDGIVMPYGEYTPAKDDHKNALVVWLHGAGEGVGKAGNYGNDNYVDLLGNEVTSLVSDEFQTLMKGAYVITPQAQTMWMDGGDGQYQNGEKGSMYRKTLMELIENVVKNNPDIDPKNVIIGGCSNGGYMTMEMILNYPTYFAKAYPICEAFYDENITDAQIKALADSKMGIWFTYSKDDDTVDPTKCSIPTIARLKKAGADVYTSVYEHVVDTSGKYKDADGNAHQYSGHWSWIYFFNNQNVCDDANCTLTEWQWLAGGKHLDTKGHKGANTSDPTTFAGLAGYGLVFVVGMLGAVLLAKKRFD